MENLVRYFFVISTKFRNFASELYIFNFLSYIYLG